MPVITQCVNQGRMLRVFGSFLLLMASMSSAFSATGRVGVLSDGKYRFQTVELERSDSPNGLSNAWIKIVSPPSDLRADENGCLCFAETDIRFSYVQAYYQGTKQLQLFDEALRRQSLPQLKKVILTLKKAPLGTMPGGQTLGHSVTFFLSPNAPIDETLFAHELGHVLHFALVSDFIPLSTTEQQALIVGVREGMANILSALYTGESRIGVISYGDAMRDLNRFFRSPDELFSLKDDQNRILQSSYVRENFPTTFRESTTDPMLKTINMNLPEPYQSSSVFTQPLWLAAQHLSRDEVLDLIISTTHQYGLEKSYGEVAADLIRMAKKLGNSELAGVLSRTFGERGI